MKCLWSNEAFTQILYESLQYRKVCAQWGADELLHGSFMEHIMRYQKWGTIPFHGLFLLINCGINYFDPFLKNSSMEWSYHLFPQPKKSRSSRRARKLMLTCFFYVNSPGCWNVWLWARLLMLSATVLHYISCVLYSRTGDVAYCHAWLFSSWKTLLKIFRRKSLEHLSYFPDLSLFNYKAYGPLKKALK